MTTLGWKLNRLRLMGPGEIAWRIGQQLRARAAGWGLGLVREVPPPAHDRWGASFLDPAPPGLDHGAMLRAAERIVAGRWNVFALQDIDLGFPPRWNQDPKTGTRAPLTQGQRIDYRDERIVGDIKYLWEPSRHLELVTLAAASREPEGAGFAAAARRLLESWFEQCPYPMGVHWSSSLELAVRLLNWAAAWHLLGGAQAALFSGADGGAFRERWLDSVYRHCHFVAGHFSRHSSANNHLFGEYLGLFVAASTWPCWPESARWRDLARAGLEREALLQNSPDGVNREQATYYHHEVMDMMLLCQRVAQAGGGSFSAAFLDRLERMAEFVAALMDVAGQVPMFGDADDAQMLRLSHETGWSPYRSLLAACALLFGRGDFKAKAGERLDDKNRRLFGAEGVQRWDALAASVAAPRTAFPAGGYWVLGSDLETPDEVRIVVDCAPLGYLAIAAHGHADALSFTLSAGGLELLVDPGTYAYHANRQWRDHFRGTLAHNTVCVDGQDQSVIGGNFMWLAKAHTQRIQIDAPGPGVQVFEGRHDGYTRLPDPVRHTRRLAYDSRRRELTVIDRLDCKAAHHIDVAWQFDERCEVRAEAGTLVATRGGRRLQMAVESKDLALSLLRGSLAPPGGWVSRRFDHKEPAWSARWSGRIDGPATLVTHIRID